MNIRMTSAALPRMGDESRTEKILTTFRRWFIAYRKYRLERAAMTQLAAMSDRDLRDIGLTRGEIERAVRGDLARERALRRYY